ncbi:MAG: hypothetical protein J5857_03000 [Treponema sp.]|nr:hypothetical protein [Treponema sp.]
MLGGLEKENVLKALSSENLDLIIQDIISGQTVQVDSKFISHNPHGIILVSKAYGELDQSVGNKVCIQFYVNQVGYCFDSVLQDSSMGLAIVIPEKIERVKSNTFSKPQSVSARILYHDCADKEVTIPCYVEESNNLLSKPAWNNVPQSIQDECRKLMAQFINERKQESSAMVGNGIYLIPVSVFLCNPEIRKNLNDVHGTQLPLDLIYVDSTKIVFGKREYAPELELEADYTLMLEIKLSAFLTRSIIVECTVSDIYSTSYQETACYLCKVTKIKTEDERFISERMT